MSMNFSDLARFAVRPFPDGYPVEDHVTLCADDAIPAALGFFADSAKHSLSLVVPGLGPDALATAILRKLQNGKVFVQLCITAALDDSPRDNALLVAANMPNNSVTFGNTPVLSLGAIDGLDSFAATENLASFTRHPLVAFHTRHQIDLIQNDMRKAAGGEH